MSSNANVWILKTNKSRRRFYKNVEKNLENEEPTEEEICLVKLTLEQLRNLTDELA